MALKKRKNTSPRKSGRSSDFGPNDKLRNSGGAKSNGGSIYQLTLYGVAALVVAIALGLVLNSGNADPISKNDDKFMSVINSNLTVEPLFADYLGKACDETGYAKKNNDTANNKAWCGNGKIEATRRTLQASAAGTRPIRRGDTLVEIPREFQIWEIDAFRSDFVQIERLWKARHELTDNPLPGGAFLAAYLAHERRRLSEQEAVPEEGGSEDGEMADSPGVQKEKLRASYFKSLPSWDELSAHHPLLKSRSELQSMLGHHSWNFAVVVMYQEMVASEYKALTAVSPQGFGQKVTIEEYQTARIHVLTRSFNPGADACSAEVDTFFSPEDLERLQSEWGVRSSNKIFADGCHAMVPILDTLNSHPRPNVVYKYDLEEKVFVISAKTKISPEWELMDSYGMYSDAHLYAKFGFVNGDGSGHTQASIAVFHRPLDVQISQEFTLIPDIVTYGGDNESQPLSAIEKIPEFQRNGLKRYLTFDDGYSDCIQKDLHPEAYKLKQLKWMHLAKIANDPKSWIVTLQPRAPKSRPRESSDLLISEVPPKIDSRTLRMDLTRVMDTCRLLELILDDYEGNAIQVLTDNLNNDTFVVAQGNDSLEYRSLMCLARLAGTALVQYNPSNVNKEFENALKLNKEHAFGKDTWTAAQLRLGEMQSLEAVWGTAMAFARQMSKDMEKTEMATSYKIRDKSCPAEYTDIIEEKLDE
mmetsp:Transcript_28217/g.66242  ORF Transcript_28217/g.66242 Transcript_28217/m.66242 type:complete len:701 (+) Transcript_28217:179-2281(+)